MYNLSRGGPPRGSQGPGRVVLGRVCKKLRDKMSAYIYFLSDVSKLSPLQDQ